MQRTTPVEGFAFEAKQIVLACGKFPGWRTFPLAVWCCMLQVYVCWMCWVGEVGPSAGCSSVTSHWGGIFDNVCSRFVISNARHFAAWMSQGHLRQWFRFTVWFSAGRFHKKALLKGRARHLHKAEAPHFAKCDPAAFFLLSQQQNVALTRAYTQRKKASLQYTHIFVKIEHSFAPKNYVHLGQ